MILLRESCAQAIADGFSVVASSPRGGVEPYTRILLPSDICDSVPAALSARKISFSFYKVQRNWGATDHYDFEEPPNPDSVVLVSDQFNFQSINLEQLHGYAVILDFAHCSHETAIHYFDQTEGFKVLGGCVSFGKGKYYRFGGGGIWFTSRQDLEIIDLPDISYDASTAPEEVLTYGVTRPKATRIVLRHPDFDQSRINYLRSLGHDISDGLSCRVTGLKNVLEWYFWVTAKTDP